MRDAQAAAPPPPSGRQLALASAGAALVAAVILFVAVLPAEYGVDPLGTGAALGLLPADPAAGSSPDGDPPPDDAGALTPEPMGAVSYYAAPFAVDQITFELGPYEYVEYKYRLEQGASMQFAWEASSPVLHELHADPDGADGHDPVSFDRQERSRAFGTHTAPFAGMHGWLWENPGGDEVTVTLTSAGFYSSALEYRSNGTRVVHAVESLARLTGALAPEPGAVPSGSSGPEPAVSIDRESPPDDDR